jgi:hypothetical protein
MFGMRGRPLPGGITPQAIRRAAGAALVLLALAAPLRPAAADDDPYSATVTVDATADNVAKARDMARLDGQKKALAAVVDRLNGGSGSGNAKLAKLTDNQITDLVASFEVADEKMTAVRYVASYTYHFQPAALKTALTSAGISVAPSSAGPPANAAVSPDSGAKPIIVLPVWQDGTRATLWDDPNPWRQAWQKHPAGSGATHLMVPLGDVGDITVIDAEKARGGDAEALAAIAKKYGGDDALLLLAVPRTGDKPGLDVTVRRYHAGQFLDVHSESIDANPGEKDSDLDHRAADVIAADIDSGWKNLKEPAGPPGSLVAVLPINGLDDWIKLRDQVSTLPSIRKVELQSLSRQEARINIQYVGNLDQLKSSLATIGLDLESGDPWRLARSAADHP